MTSLTSTLFLSLIFHQVLCCMPPNSSPTKENFCANLATSNMDFSIAKNLTEFCQSGSVGETGNSLCEMDINDGFIQNTGLANEVAEFCNPGSPILRNREINIRVGISQDASTDQDTDRYRIKIVDPMCAIM